MSSPPDPTPSIRHPAGEAPPFLEDRSVHLWLFSIDRPERPLEALEECLDDEERARAARFHFDVHRRRFIAGRGQLRHLLAGYLDLTPSAVRFAYGAQGKPQLDGRLADGARLHFNLSHSEGVAMLGCTRDADIGVDVEAVRQMHDAADVAGDNFSKPEVEAWLQLPEAQRSDGFFACWSRKEAIVKAMGGGLSIPLDSFQVTLDPSAEARLLSIDDEPDAPARWTLWGERVLDGFWGAVAVRAPNAKVRRFTLG